MGLSQHSHSSSLSKLLCQCLNTAIQRLQCVDHGVVKAVHLCTKARVILKENNLGKVFYFFIGIKKKITIPGAVIFKEMLTVA